ncbi:hypothetical protein [Bradyrhizobium sp. Arg816]|uniref:hypothetical protein n=1 Tax=Bradyrhizobium sp. Arg816 TaxID=2998491 RepID=UPI00249F6C20|nr:hypothetical protein [Bradyrhizobium sp. Arg816]MDI3560226.1 hypothetical protein [Bradyrhizobium sp. Arg816]
MRLIRQYLGRVCFKLSLSIAFAGKKISGIRRQGPPVHAGGPFALKERPQAWIKDPGLGPLRLRKLFSLTRLKRMQIKTGARRRFLLDSRLIVRERASQQFPNRGRPARKTFSEPEIVDGLLVLLRQFHLQPDGAILLLHEHRTQSRNQSSDWRELIFSLRRSQCGALPLGFNLGIKINHRDRRAAFQPCSQTLTTD